MTDKEEKEMNCSAIINLKDIGVHIGRKDKECIKKWLWENKITIHRLAKLTFVYKVDFECAMILPHVKDRQRKDPKGWQAYYQKTIKNEALFELIMLELKVNVQYKPTTKVKRSKSDEELYKQLLT
ncbi:hypothetical protein E0I26_04075 [Flavobacterium rhamnosiphilum]|uniref:Uncharacterized protein n=1 Tax=Flavobacterium rhamnosiphilum TaxID=2541724 RepID=A0A4V2Z9X5_9FLAO|nr:hypothetical protein [Flavobacterium rhamnosiphilum]TDE45873.1 hypothetical protein E0I26_04075 [Flavobacterium rhamnosiphilum]